jgi:hypothetical protein
MATSNNEDNHHKNCTLRNKNGSEKERERRVCVHSRTLIWSVFNFAQRLREINWMCTFVKGDKEDEGVEFPMNVIIIILQFKKSPKKKINKIK